MTGFRFRLCLNVLAIAALLCGCASALRAQEDLVGGAGETSSGSNSNRPARSPARTSRPKTTTKRSTRARQPAPEKSAGATTATGTLAVAAEPLAVIYVEPVEDEGDAYEARIPAGERLYVFTDLPPGRYIAYAELDGYQTAEKEVVVVASKAASVTLNLQPLAKQPAKPITPPKVIAPLPTAATFKAAGDKLAAKGKWVEAEAEYRRALQLEPDIALRYAQVAEALSQQQKWADAEFFYREAIRLEPNLSPAALGLVLFKQKKFMEAEAAFRKASEQEPNNAKLLINLGEAAAQQQKWTTAEAAYRQAVKLEPDKALWHGLLAFALYNKSELGEAAAEYREAIRLQPNDARSHFNLAMVYHALGNKDAAMAQHAKLKSLDPNLANKLLSELSK
jgi:tetratricopeptide (TPR) repeat protein